jgi:hypothetical protein
MCKTAEGESGLGTRTPADAGARLTLLNQPHVEASRLARTCVVADVHHCGLVCSGAERHVQRVGGGEAVVSVDSEGPRVPAVAVVAGVREGHTREVRTRVQLVGPQHLGVHKTTTVAAGLGRA